MYVLVVVCCVCRLALCFLATIAPGSLTLPPLDLTRELVLFLKMQTRLQEMYSSSHLASFANSASAYHLLDSHPYVKLASTPSFLPYVFCILDNSTHSLVT
jgi:hypothetical protein